MNRREDALLKAMFVLIWTLVVVHALAEYNYWYWTYRWLDIPMHFLGGAWLGIAGIWLVHRFPRLHSSLGMPSHMLVAVLTGLLIGVLWEGYERAIWLFTAAELPANYIDDTLLDLIMDVIGAWVGYVALRPLLDRTETT